MKTRSIYQNETLDINLTKSVKQLKRAEIAAWLMFIGIGITYVVLSLFVAL